MTETDLLQMIVDEINSIQVLEPNDATISRICAMTGRKVPMVTNYLNDKVQGGELVVVKKYDPNTGRNVNVYQAKIQ